MNKKNKFEIHHMSYIIPVAIFILMYLFTEYTMISSMKKHFYTHYKEESISFANSYSHNLSKAAEAKNVINEILEDKLIIASKTTSQYQGQYSNELIRQLAKRLEVDEIYAYNPQGEIIYSNNNEYIGWKAYNGHPVYDFMISNKSSFVEEIRKDSGSNKLYKYGYFKESNGYFVQIGILAERIQDFIGSFEMQRLLDEMNETDDTAEICFIDNNFIIQGSTNKELIGTYTNHDEVKAAITENKEYTTNNKVNGEDYYDVYVPVSFQNNIIGALHVRQSLTNIDEIINPVTGIISLSMSIAIISILYLIITLYKKNKNLIGLAYYDTLTGLPNREYFLDFISNIFKKIKDDKKAILVINLINYRNINLSYGIEYSDKMIHAVANKLKSITKSNKMIFRTAGSRFVYFVDNYETEDDLLTIESEIRGLFNSPIIENQYAKLKISIIEINKEYKSVDEILKNALIALDYIQKINNKNSIIFKKELFKSFEREELIEKEIRTALEDQSTKNIYLEYQPQVDLKTHKIIGFEALARMNTDSLGFISPNEFINVAEKKDLIVPLGNFILQTACDFISRLNKLGHQDVKVAVNISGIQLLQDDFTKTVIDIVKDKGIKTSNLELEITESILIENYEVINDKLKSFRDIGIKIALDDFGTGYSSFSRLSELNIDCVKIDQYFIRSIDSKDEKVPITGDIISMSHKIGHTVVAEGVEIEEQKTYLKDNNCDIMQGYLFSRPVAENIAVDLLK